MQYLRFMPLVDVPTIIVVLAIFILNFHWWANATHDPSMVDLTARLAKAKIRVVLCFAAILLFCWLCDVSFCVILAMALLAGVFFFIAVGGDGMPGAIVLAVAVMIRE